MRWALTGASGFLGSQVLAEFHRSGLLPTLLGRAAERNAKPGQWRYWTAGQSVAEIVEALKGIDALCHIAAYVPADMTDPMQAETCWQVNALGTLKLLEACEQAGVRRFVHISGANIIAPRRRALRESDGIGVVHAPYYLSSKAVAEMFVLARTTSRLKTMILRPSAIYGPGMRASAITHFAARLSAGQSVSLRDGGRFRADYVEVADVARLILLAATSTRCGVMNIGSGVATSIADMASELCQLIGADSGLLHLEPAMGAGPSGFSALDIRRARKWFGFEPTSLKDGLRRYLESC